MVRSLLSMTSNGWIGITERGLPIASKETESFNFMFLFTGKGLVFLLRILHLVRSKILWAGASFRVRTFGMTLIPPFCSTMKGGLICTGETRS